MTKEYTPIKEGIILVLTTDLSNPIGLGNTICSLLSYKNIDAILGETKV